MEIDKIEMIAKVCHGAIRAICQAYGDECQPEWESAADWQKQSTIDGIIKVIENPDISSEDLHNEWMKYKIEDGWVYGDVKDVDKKTHPCLVPYEYLSGADKVKDYVFKSIVRSMI